MSALFQRLNWNSNKRQGQLYQPLNPDRKEIRILVLRGLEDHGRICCDLQRVSLLEDPPPVYETVSWCWGTSRKTRKICLDGQIISVSANAEEVLRRVGVDRDHSCLWLDAVCINQADAAERSQQVAIMKHVYQSARRVLIWLGEIPTGIAQSFQSSVDVLLAQALDCVTNEAALISLVLGQKRAPLASWSDPLPHCDWDAIALFFNCSWFTRLWVVQEVVLSKEALCYFGSSSRPWPDVRLAATWLLHRNYVRPQYAGRKLVGIENAITLSAQSLGSTTLNSALLLSTVRDCSLPHDKVYGMLGLIDKNHLSTLTSALIPDYTLPLDVVYTMATRMALEENILQSKCLILLDWTQSAFSPSEDTAKSATWPSWVPRYDRIRWHDKDSLKIYPRNFQMDAGNGFQVKMRLVEGSNILSLQGLVIDRMKTLHGRPIKVKLSREDAEAHVRCRSLALAAGNTEPDFAFTLVGGENLERQEAHTDPRLLPAYRDFMSFHEELAARKGTAALIADKPRMLGVGLYSKTMQERSTNRKFCLTRRGLMVMAPPAARPGDFLCVLFGGLSPYVIRQEGKYWRLIGTAYAHGVMHGEYVRQVDFEGRLEAEMRWFDIH